MGKVGAKSILVGAIIGGILGALLGAVVASRRSGNRKPAGPSATDITGIGMTALALAKQVIDAFS